MRVLGIDCGSRSTGFGIIESDDKEHRTITFGAIQFHSADAFSRRLVKIHGEIQRLILTYSPTATAIEDQFYLSNFKSVMKLGQIKGVVILTAASAGIPVFEYSPLEVKSAVTGYGRAEKRQVQVMVRNILKLPNLPTPDDASDALALAVCHIHTLETRTKLDLAESAFPRGAKGLLA